MLDVVECPRASCKRGFFVATVLLLVYVSGQNPYG